MFKMIHSLVSLQFFIDKFLFMIGLKNVIAKEIGFILIPLTLVVAQLLAARVESKKFEQEIV